MASASNRRAGRCVCAVVLAVWLAPGGVNAEPVITGSTAQPILLSASRIAALGVTGEPYIRARMRAPVPESGREDRPRALLPLYIGFGALQALDAHSTMRAVNAGRAERNPLIAPFADRPGAMIGVKAAATAGTLAIAEKLWRRNRAAAVTLLIAANVGYAAVVAHNYRQARR